LPDGRQYTSFWWTSALPPDGCGFVLSPAQGRALRARLAAGTALRVRAHVASRFYDGTLEVVEAALPGTGGGEAPEVLVVSHLCHPKPSAHDNASGAAALLEAVCTLARLTGSRELAPAQRTIRCLWVPEMTGTYAWLSAHEEEVRRGRWLAALI